MKSLQQYITESLTETSTLVEVGVCIAYNMKHNKHSFENAAKQANIAKGIYNKVTPDLMEIANKIVDQAGNLGPFLDHSGRAMASANNYASKLGTGASDKTPKTDFIGDTNHAISLKKGGENKMAGSQLMSAASGEASGVVKAAILHFQHNKGNISNEKQLKEVLTILGEEMRKTASNTMNVEVKKGKENFQSWYFEKSPRRKELLDMGHKPKKVELHLKGELSLLRVIPTNSAASSWLIDGVDPIDERGVRVYFQKYIEDETQTATNTTVSARYLEKVDPKNLTDLKLKEQITEVLEVSMKTKAWQEKLGQFFNDNEDFKKYLVYEASSGLFKFTGELAGKGNYKGGEPAVAKQIIVFNEGGIKNYHQDIWKWSTKNTHLANNLSIAYKGSGRSRYIKVALMAGKIYDEELPMLTEELKNIEKEFLSEGFFGDIGRAIADRVTQTVNAILKFTFRVVDKVINGLNTLLERGLDIFLEELGVDVDVSGGGVAVNTPNW